MAITERRLYGRYRFAVHVFLIATVSLIIATAAVAADAKGNPSALSILETLSTIKDAAIVGFLFFARKLVVGVTDSRSREKDSPLGQHEADPLAHEAMRAQYETTMEDLIERVLLRYENGELRAVVEEKKRRQAMIPVRERL